MEKITGTEFQPIETRPLNGGEQKVYRFANGYGASVVQSSYSYGGDEGLWEVGVIEFKGKSWELTYDTSIANDVLGWLSDDDVRDVLVKIAALPQRSAS